MYSEPDGHFIAGEWRPSIGSESVRLINPATGEALGCVPVGTVEDVDAAVSSARHAFAEWCTSRPEERRAALRAIADGIEARAEEFAGLISAEMGAPRDNALEVQTLLPVEVLRAHADLVPSFEFREVIGHSLVVKEPIGVVGAITPWNYPLYQICTKLAPALAAGCTMVLKPSEVTSFDALLLAEVTVEAGLPPGVFNVVTGLGSLTGESLVRHRDVDMISFTGSTKIGRRISELAAETVKRVALELGGKSASIVLPDADLEQAVRASVANVVYNTGQTCTAWTRLLVDEDRYHQAVAIAADEMRRQRLDDPALPGSHLGPVATAAQLEKVRSLVQQGIAEGARLVVGGPEGPEDLQGLYVKPTLFAEVTPDMSIAREEIFGPVLAAMSYRTVDEAVEIANQTDYGLGGVVWSSSDEAAWRVARRLRTGRVDLNGADFNPLAPTGGFKQSGNGRELGAHGIDEFCELKAVQFPSVAALQQVIATDGRPDEPFHPEVPVTGGQS